MPNGHLLILLGIQSVFTPTLSIYNPSTSQWNTQHLNLTSNIQLNRTGFATCLIHDITYIIQGEETYDQPYFDKHFFTDILTLSLHDSLYKVNKIPTTSMPMPARKQMASSSLFDRYIVVYGGISPTNKYLNTLFSFDTIKRIWLELPLFYKTKDIEPGCA
jgi:hypothetical protein